MARGDAARRRRKVQERASLLKRGPQAAALGPERTPTKRKPDSDMTRAMRKMLQLKAAAEAAKASKQQRQGHLGQQAGAVGKPGAHRQRTSEQQQPSEQQQQQQQQQQQGGLDRVQQHVAPAPAGKQAGGGKPGTGGRADQDHGFGQQKALKARKKEYLQKKKLKKKGRGEEALVEKEAALAAKTAYTAPRFGEQAYQPLKVQLKRKHWAGEGSEGATASKRCTEIFNRQMEEAKRAAAAAEAARDDGAVQQAPRKTGGKQGGKQQQSKGSKQGGKGGRQQTKGSAADEATRQQLIDAYRQQKLQRLEAAGKAPLLSATQQSLEELVRRDAAARR